MKHRISFTRTQHFELSLLGVLMWSNWLSHLVRDYRLRWIYFAGKDSDFGEPKAMENSTDLLWQKALEDRQNGTLDSIPQNLDCLSTQLSLIAVFVYDVDKGGFAQYVYNSKGLYLGETLDLFHIPKAANAAKHLGEVIEHCLTNEEAYQVFLSSNYDASDFKNTLHSISFQYFKSDLSLRTTA